MPNFSAMKDLLSGIAFVVTIALFVGYIRSIRVAETVPHVFSWLVWAGGTLVVFLAQLAAGGGVGSWPIGLSGCFTAYIAYLAYGKRQQSAIKPLDWVFFALAIMALPAWWLASDPSWAVVLLTSADLIGFGPTFRRAYHHPYQEHAGFFGLGALRNLLVVFALERYSWTTVLFPAAVGIACLCLASLLYVRRRVVPRNMPSEELRGNAQASNLS
jgi:hypothetical protein